MNKKSDRPKVRAATSINKTNIPRNFDLRYTLFGDHHAREMKVLKSSFEGLFQRLKSIKPCKKATAPMIKLATFKRPATAGGCLRKDSALLKITGIEGDYDAGVVSPKEAIKRLEAHRIRAVVVTTHSHTPENPRWRVLAPLASPTLPGERRRLVGGLNGALGGILAPESWTLSQAYYIGRPLKGEYRVLMTFDDPRGGACLDQWKDLDEVAMGKLKNNEGSKDFADISVVGSKGRREQFLEELLTGTDVHGNARQLIASLVGRGMDDASIRLIIESAAVEVAKNRGKTRAALLRGSELDRLIDGAREKGFGPKTPLPLPDGLPSVMALDPEMLPPAIRGYVMDVADRQRSPPDFVAVAAICGLSALVGRKVLVRPKQNDDWTVTPNQWAALVGRPSTMKSPSMKEALKPLQKIEKIASRKYKEDLGLYEFRATMAGAAIGDAKKDAARKFVDGDQDGALQTWNAAKFSDSTPVRQRLIVSDATVEKLGELLNENPNGLILVRDELFGWISKLMQEDRQGERAFYLECFDGNGRYVYDRIERGTIEIENCTLSVIGGIQPSRIAQIVRGAIRGTADDGLVQRLQLTVWPDDSRPWKWVDRLPDAEALRKYQDAIDQLHAMSIAGESDQPAYLQFSAKAQKAFIHWNEALQIAARRDDVHPILESHLLKMPQTIAGLALLFELLRGGRKLIRDAALQQALQWATYLRSHAERLYSILKNGDVDGAKLILSRRAKLREKFTARDIQRKGWVGLDALEGIYASLECLEEHNHISVSQVPSGQSGGRPTTEYRWNPALLQGSKNGEADEGIEVETL